MNRAADLIQTLLPNIDANAGYPQVEFVLLDYNSTDGLAEWVAANLMPQIGGSGTGSVLTIGTPKG